MDKPGREHDLNILLKPGISNTEQSVREYQFTADNELNAITLYGFNSTGTKTMSALPSNTIGIHLYLSVYDNLVPTFLNYKRSSGDTQTFIIGSGIDNGGDFNYHRGNYWMPTNGNQIYIVSITGVVQYAVIIGYKVRGDNL